MYINFPPNSLNVFITNALNSLSDKLVFVSLVIFSEIFSLPFQLRVDLCLFILLKFVSMNLGETVSFCSLGGVVLGGSFPYRLSTWCLWESWISCGCKPVFLQGTLAALMLVGGGAGDAGARAGAGWEVGLPFCSVAITVY